MNRFLQNTMLAFLLTGASGTYAIEPVDGVYQLGSTQDWVDFAAVVAADNSTEYNVVFTADINLEENQTTIKGLNGTVDGAGHTLTVAYTNAPTRTAPFATAGNVTIKNLRITGSIASTSNCIGGFIGNVLSGSNPTIENCVSELAISTTATGDCHLGGFIGRASDGTGFTVKSSLSKCSYTIPASGKSVGGIIGYGGNSSSITLTVENCIVYPSITLVGDGTPSSANALRNIGNRGTATIQAAGNYLIDNTSLWSTYAGNSSDGTRIKTDAAILTSGELAHNLDWGQNLNVADDIPSPLSGDKVYAVTFKGNNEIVVYANANGVKSLPSASELGVSGWVAYTLNGEPFAANTPIDSDIIVEVGTKQPGADGFYELASAEDWCGFASLFTSANTASYNARFVNDIDLGDNQAVINNFRGTLDGNGYTLTVHYVATGQRYAPIQNSYDAVVKNLHTAGTITSAYAQPAGIMGNVNSNSTVTIEGCSSSIDFTLTLASGEITAGGILARASDATLATISNCLFSGTFTFTSQNAKNISGILGYANSADKAVVKNCFVIGSYVLPEGVEFSSSSTASTYGLNAVRRGSATLENNYARDPESRWACYNQATRLQGSQLVSGEAAYLLQNNQSETFWGQPDLNTINAAESPVLTSENSARVVKLIVIDKTSETQTYADEEGTVCYANAGGVLPSGYDGETFKDAQGNTLTTAPTEDATIYVYPGISTSIDAVNAEVAGVVDVYNIQGVLIRHNVATEHALENLTSGLYIINGKKYLIK